MTFSINGTIVFLSSIYYSRVKHNAPIFQVYHKLKALTDSNCMCKQSAGLLVG